MVKSSATRQPAVDLEY